ncbi:MAG TPA: FAD:protein FMN transferase [Gaiellaceae bacterium]
MGTEIELLVESDDATDAFDAVEVEFERLEQVLSRFRPDSELSLLNQNGSIDASPDLAQVLWLAVDARERTDGRFDPTVHDALVGAGYDRTFDDVPRDVAAASAASECGGRVSVEGQHIEIERGYRIDLGGIGKGYAAERAAELLALTGPCLVNAGGDVAMRGLPTTGVWSVAVDGSITLGLTQGGVATSGRDRRRWRRGGKEQHHLIDPRTGAPAETDLLRVTAVGDDAVAAEILAKSLFLAGEREAADSTVPAVLVTADGRTRLSRGLGR